MTRTVTAAVTAADIAAGLADHDLVARAIERALPGVSVGALDPVDVELSVTDPGTRRAVRWACPTPDAVGRHLYHPGAPAPYSFDLHVPDCLAGFLCRGPGRDDAP